MNKFLNHLQLDQTKGHLDLTSLQCSDPLVRQKIRAWQISNINVFSLVFVVINMVGFLMTVAKILFKKDLTSSLYFISQSL